MRALLSEKDARLSAMDARFSDAVREKDARLSEMDARLVLATASTPLDLTALRATP